MGIKKIERAREKIEKRNNLTFKLLKFIKIFNLRKSIYMSIYEPLPQPQPQFKEILKLAKELSTKNNSNFYFVYLTGYHRYKTTYHHKSYNKVKKIIEELNIPFIDIHKEVFEKESNPLKLFPFELSGHYNVEGFRKVAEAIHKFISK